MRRSRSSKLGTAIVAATAMLVTPAAHAQEAPDAPPRYKRFAVVVGTQKSPDPVARPNERLSYTDDDALNMYELLTAAGVETAVYTEPDDETKQLHPDWDKIKIGRPRYSDVLLALKAMARKAMAAKKADPDLRIEVFFVFSGHGDSDSLVLHDKRSLTGSDIEAVLLSPTAGTKNDPGIDAVHLVIDACGVASGQDTSSFVRRLQLYDNPHAGVLMAMTGFQQTIEWGSIGAGVFSYEVRSGLLGGADLVQLPSGPPLFQGAPLPEPDASVTYREIGAFVAMANEAVKKSEVKIFPVQQPPGIGTDYPLLEWDPAGLGVSYDELLLPHEQPIWVRVSDPNVIAQAGTALPRVLYLAEAHLGVRAKEPTKLRLPKRSRYHVALLAPDGKLLETREFDPARDGSSANVLALPLAPLAKGLGFALKDGLFRAPHNERELASYRRVGVPNGDPGLQFMGTKKPNVDPPMGPIVIDDHGSAWPWIACIGTVTAGVLTGIAYDQSNQAYEEWKQAPNESEYDRLDRKTTTFDILTTIGVIATPLAAAGCAGTVIHELSKSPSRPTQYARRTAGSGFSVRF